ncbi:type IV toxin-antitoxin system AbiEi family antitoxin domain-containing protein [Nocardioides acrostichi]|uniref:Type IV toxin-antitoxin system AbiEi family antitoxin domain-containing protein n=1 Tax=Nocardioides acrostichi TaxID=2784339 RepID=A0A930UXZ9_9ACTN|nr:type IV toxin-antitoxin system AbiEi family antitoxin domain-containing protein [Nocardioides acrostichi]MBF4160080.1 type IV toxin-antitoxin system AbiEi family antitoxin domain-containing protein [Nocardioides acrostichi]
MDDISAGLFGRHGGLLTRRQALDHGLPPEHIGRMLRSGAWTTVWRGVYALTAHWESLDAWRERPRLVSRAASRHMRRAHVVSHDSAAHELGLDILRVDRPLVHVTRPGALGGRTEHGVKHHKARFARADVVEIDGRRVLGPARTAVDIAREHGYLAGLVACDSARRSGVRVDQLEQVAGQMWSWPNVTIVRRAIHDSDAGADSVLETLGRQLVEDLGLGRPETQFGLRRDGRTVFCDLRIGRHVIEMDGRLKYLPSVDGGVAVRPVEDVLWAEKQRQDFVSSFRLGISRLVWADCWGERRAATIARLHREVAQTRSLWGDDISDLAPFRAVREPRRPWAA